MGFSLSVIIPALNEEKSIGVTVRNVLSAISRCPQITRYELILINDGSTDGSRAVMQQIAREKENVTILDNETNRGVGFSYKRGLQAATCDYCSWVPSDDTFSSDSLHKLYSRIGSADIILHYPQVQNRKLYRMLLSKLYIQFLNFLFGIHTIRYYNGLAIYKRSDILFVTLRSSGFAFQAELLIKVLKGKERKIVQVPIFTTERAHGSTKSLKAKNILDVCKSLYRLHVDVYRLH